MILTLTLMTSDTVNYIQPGKFWVNTETQRLAYWNNSNPECRVLGACGSNAS